MMKKVWSALPFILSFAFLQATCIALFAQSPPVAVEDEVYTIDNVSTSGDLSLNDLNPSGSVLTYTLLQDTPYGDLVVNTDGSWTFVPNPDAAAINQILTYQVCDQIGQCSIGNIGLFIQFHNDPPQAEDDYVFAEVNSSALGNLSANDFDPDYLTDPVSTLNSYQNITNPSNGTVFVNFDGSFTYTPNPGFTGNDSFMYVNCDACSVCDVASAFITVVSSNENPQAVDATINASEDVPLNGSLVGLAIDQENDPLNFSLDTPPTHGVVSVFSDGDFIYTPDADFSGLDGFSFSVCDIVGQCDVAWITLSVAEVNDPPVTGNEWYSFLEDSNANVGTAVLLDSDDGGVLSYLLVQNPAHGSLVLSSNGDFTYTPDPNYFGSDFFVLNVCDNEPLCGLDTVFIAIIGINDPPLTYNQDNYGYEDDLLSAALFASDPDGDNLTYTLLNGGSGGIFNLDADGSYIFTPNANFSGILTVTFQVCDPDGLCDQADLLLEIIEINDDPVINADEFIADEDVQITGDLRPNDLEPDGEEIFYFTISDPQHGELTLESDGHFTYMPEANWSGTEVISFYGCDPCAVCGLSTLTIHVQPVNDLPVAISGIEDVNEDASLNSSLTPLVSDVDDAMFDFSISVDPVHGSVIADTEGSYVYTPEANYAGSDSFEFETCDASGGCVNQTVFIQVIQVNDAPVAMDESFTMDEDVQLADQLSAASDVDNTELIYSVMTEPSNGMLSLSANGSFVYTPNENYYGADSFVCEICDPLGACTSENVSLEINPLQDAPVGVDDFNVTYQNEFLLGEAGINDFDADGEILTYNLVNNVSHGILILNEDGSFEYYPALDFSGADQFTYAVCDPSGACDEAVYNITVFTTNTAPIAADASYSVNEDNVYSSSLVPLVTDAEGGVFSFQVLSEAVNGNLVFLPNGNFIYSPVQDFFGSDEFTYRVCDSGNRCDTAIVFMEVLPVDDAPYAANDMFEGLEDLTVEGSVQTNDGDIDGDVLIYSLVTSPGSGLLILSTNGDFVFQPALNFNGALEFQYEVCDLEGLCTEANASILLLAVNDSPTVTGESFNLNEDTVYEGDLSLNDLDLDGNALSYAVLSETSHGNLVIFPDGTVVYTPDTDYFGADSFTYEVCDNGGLCSQGLVNITIVSVNDQPVVDDDAYAGLEDNTISGSINTNDVDPEQTELTYSLLNSPDGGSIELSPNGLFVYSPDADYFGMELLDVLICDANNACVQSQLTIDVQAVNDPPIAVNDNYSMLEDEVQEGTVAFNDSDVDNLDLTYNLLSQPLLGVVSLSLSGSFNYSPFANASGLETIVYEVCDGGGLCTQAEINILVEAVNDAPITQGEYVHVMEETIGTGDVSGNDTDPDDVNLNYTVLESTQFGGFSMDEAGNYSYAPYLNFWGIDSVVYQACDAQGLCSTATLVLEVDFVNDAPIVYDESIQVLMNQSVSGDVSLNDLELDDENLVYFVLEDDSNGQFTMLDDGSYTYTPNSDVTGVFEVIYYACDPCSVCDEGLLTFYVLPAKDLNTPPLAVDGYNETCADHIISIDMSELISDTQNEDFEMTLSFAEPEMGSLTYDAENLTLMFDPAGMTNGSVSIEYTVCDAGLLSMCDTAHVIVEVTEVLSPMVNEWTIHDVSCYGDADGSIEITMVSGGNSFEYAWDNDSTGAALNGLAAGIYTLTLTSDMACSIPASFTYEIEAPQTPLVATMAMSVNISDEFDGAIFIDIAGGSPPYDIAWSGPADYSSIEEDIANLTSEGFYTAVVTDANGCTTDLAVLISGLYETDFPAFVNLSPNPCEHEVTLMLQSSKPHRLTYALLDASGRLVSEYAQGVVMSGKWVLDTSQLAAGFYCVKVNLDGFTQTLPLVKSE